MEYKSEIIDFEKEDMESKKRMLGSDKVNIEEIKKRLHDVTTEQFNLGAEMDAEHEFNTNAQSDMAYLLSVIEQRDKEIKKLEDQIDILNDQIN